MKKAITGLILVTIILIGCTAAEESTTPVPTNPLPSPTETAPPTATTTTEPTAVPNSTTTPDTAALNGIWQTQPSMLHARAAHAVVSTDTAIYALAGTGQNGRPVLEVESFDGSEWVLETTLPGSGLNAPAAVVFNQRIYLIGGFNTTSNIPSAEVLVYDLKAQTWDTAAPLPAPRGGHAAAVLNGKIHVVGGGNSQSTRMITPFLTPIRTHGAN